jgi:hypothetical protein
MWGYARLLGAPAFGAAMRNAERKHDYIKSQWERMGKPVIVFACTTCDICLTNITEAKRI